MILFAVAVRSSFPDDETERIMPFVKSVRNYDRKTLSAGKTILSDTLCVTCHSNTIGNHHAFGVKMKKIPDGIVLSGSDRIMCITCHDVTKQRYDSRPWKSMSLYESLFSSEKRYKTYYLIMNNNNGELCITCHSVEGERIK
jgi:hypothetical protein